MKNKKLEIPLENISVRELLHQIPLFFLKTHPQDHFNTLIIALGLFSHPFTFVFYTYYFIIRLEILP